MENTLTETKWHGLTAFQLKLIALVCMTIDHVGAYGSEVPAIQAHYSLLRGVGRVAAPIFLFLVVQSLRHTRSRKKFLLRLYLAGMGTGLFVTAMNVLLGKRLGYFTPGNILFTFFYTVLYILLGEKLIGAVRERDLRTGLLCLAGLGASVLPTVFQLPLADAIGALSGPRQRLYYLLEGLRKSLVPGWNDVDYGIGLMVLGAALYIARTKGRQCAVFAVFWAVCAGGMYLAGPRLGELYMLQSYHFFPAFFNNSQLRMICALPLLVLYNGQRGRPSKWFFYWYYPVHREIIFLVVTLLMRQ